MTANCNLKIGHFSIKKSRLANYFWCNHRIANTFLKNLPFCSHKKIYKCVKFKVNSIIFGNFIEKVQPVLAFFAAFGIFQIIPSHTLLHIYTNQWSHCSLPLCDYLLLGMHLVRLICHPKYSPFLLWYL